MKLNARHAAIVAIILALSIGFGFAFDAIATAVERAQHPRPDEFAELISENAEEYGVPEAVLWAVANVQSDFASNARGADGSIGLMQLTPAQFNMIRTEIMGVDPLDAGMLYDPATNLSCGAAYLSHLYRLYGSWETVFAAYEAGEETVNKWLKNDDYVNDLGVLDKIPDDDVARAVKRMSRALSLYTKLYY
ncbi:MAG: lytic transglycosylase domain-containing protein [Clostridia bacterium]|nr:lytic transglycosylase domain-containing protein [Clostridia bacterium]